MYDEGGDAGAAPMGGAMSKFNLEGLIPLLLLVIIGVASLNYFGVIEVPYLPRGSASKQVLFIGVPSTGERVVLDNLSYFLRYNIRDATTFGNAASEELQQYDIVILDQSISSDKSVTVGLGEAITKYVDKGGKLILVMNSGVQQSVGFGGMTAVDAIGWKANFGNTMPAECVPNSTSIPSCKPGQEVSVVGRIYRQDYDHPIMLGTEMAPTLDEAPFAMTTLAIQSNEGAKTIAYIKAENTPQSFPAILEKKNFPLGNVIYFNYDPGLTMNVFKNTIMYLK